MEFATAVDGFQEEPTELPDGSLYPGRLTLFDVQWRERNNKLIGQTQLTIRQLLDAVDADLVWTDQDVQRGIKPEKEGSNPDRELSLKNGYPDTDVYIFDAAKADEIAEQLLAGNADYLDPLIWSIRPGTFKAFADEGERKMFLYSGRIYLPDSHHRHQAIVKAARAYATSPASYPDFDIDQQIGTEIWFLTKEQEGDYFYAKNQLPKPTAKSKAYSLTTTDAISTCARLIIEKTPSLIGNVNLVTDRLSASNPQVMTLSTLREMVKGVAGIKDEKSQNLADSEVDELATFFSVRYEDLVSVRPSLGLLDLVERKLNRSHSLCDSGTMMHGYAALIGDDWGLRGSPPAKPFQVWLKPLTPGLTYEHDTGWKGDFFSRDNPLWRDLGVIQAGKGGPVLGNSRQTRQACADALRKLLGARK